MYNLVGKTEMLEPDEILARWKNILESLSEKGTYDKNVFQFDSHQLEKWGPQGEVAPIAELMDDVVLPTFLSSSKHPTAFGLSHERQHDAVV